MERDRGQIGQQGGQGGSGSMGGGGLDYSQPQWSVPKDQLRDQITNLDSFVIVGTKNGQPFLASTDDQFTAKKLVREHAQDLVPQSA